ncbi:MAG: metalloregulator ArsR/SmtB family transcription factor, partial [Ornithinimicrobium sp.]
HVFRALADPSRRQLIDRLSEGPASVSTRAELLTMTLAAVMQHVQVLEGSGLVTSEKAGRVRTCRLETSGLSPDQAWIEDRKALWERRLDRLADTLNDPERQEPNP